MPHQPPVPSPQSPTLYFAYGSNMLTARLRGSAPSARVVGAAVLRGFVLRFNKRGRDGTAKCNVVRGEATDVVHGVLFEIADAADWERLDLQEGTRRPNGYDRGVVDVECGGATHRAQTYFAKPAAIDENLRPSVGYLGYILDGAREHGLSPEYIAFLEHA